MPPTKSGFLTKRPIRASMRFSYSICVLSIFQSLVFNSYICAIHFICLFPGMPRIDRFYHMFNINRYRDYAGIFFANNDVFRSLKVV